MSLQARMSEGDDRLYSPFRDVAHNFGDVMREVAARLEDRRWPVLDKILQEKGVTMDELGEACAVLCTFVQTAVDVPRERMAEALDRSGWWKVPEPAQVAVCAMIGTVMLGYFYAGVREATLGGKGPCLNYKDLRAAGERAHSLIVLPAWKRKWLLVRDRFVNAWRAVKGG